MSQTYYIVLTTLGEQLIAEALKTGKKIALAKMAVGDGNGAIPQHTAASTKLVKEWRRAVINDYKLDPQNKNQLIVEQIIPEHEGGNWIREIALYDDTNRLIAIGNCPATYKPKLLEGSGQTQVIRMLIAVSNTDAINLKIEPSTLASRQYVDDSIKTLTASGFVSKVNGKIGNVTLTANDVSALPTTGGKLSGNLAVNGQITSTNGSFAYRIAADYGSFWRMDHSHLYLLLTKKGDANGYWNDLRPFRIDLATGNVLLGEDVEIPKTLTTHRFYDKKTQLGRTGTSAMLEISSDEDLYNLSFGTVSMCRKGGNYNLPLYHGYVRKIANRDVNTGFVAEMFGYNTPRSWMCMREKSTDTAKWYEYMTTFNTTQASNGYLKVASPIARLYCATPVQAEENFTVAGVCMINDQAPGVVGERIATGHYSITGSLGFAKSGWKIETPADENGNKLVFIESNEHADGVIVVKTYKKKFDMESGNFIAGEAMDIPDGHWIDLRLAMPKNQPETLEAAPKN